MGGFTYFGGLGHQFPIAHVHPRLHDGHLGGELGVLLSDVVYDDRLGVEVVHVGVLFLAQLLGVGQR